MGLFFERRQPSPELVNLMATAIRAQPQTPDAAHLFSAQLASNFPPLISILDANATAKTPADVDAAAQSSAQELASQLLGGVTFNTGRFMIALALWIALVGGGIATDATHLSTSTGTLFGMAGAIFGIVTAFLGSEKGSS